jgi:hypothetical protein
MKKIKFILAIILAFPVFSQTKISYDDSLLTEFCYSVDNYANINSCIEIKNLIDSTQIQNKKYHNIAKHELELFVNNNFITDSTNLIDLYKFSIKNNICIDKYILFEVPDKTSLTNAAILFIDNIYNDFSVIKYKYGISFVEYNNEYIGIVMVFDEKDPKLDNKTSTLTF